MNREFIVSLQDHVQAQIAAQDMAHLWDTVALVVALDELAYQVDQGTRIDWMVRAGLAFPDADAE